MSKDSQTGFQFPGTFVFLGDGGSAVPLPVTESFWPDLAAGRLDHLGPGRLVSYFEFTEDWNVWEVHPAGEELVCLISGSADFLLERAGGLETVPLRSPGSFLIVPRGIWHTARVHAPSTVMVVTAGEGTEHRPA